MVEPQTERVSSATMALRKKILSLVSFKIADHMEDKSADTPQQDNSEKDRKGHERPFEGFPLPDDAILALRDLRRRLQRR